MPVTVIDQKIALLVIDLPKGVVASPTVHPVRLRDRTSRLAGHGARLPRQSRSPAGRTRGARYHRRIPTVQSLPVSDLLHLFHPHTRMENPNDAYTVRRPEA